MEIFTYKITFTHLLMLIAILYIIYFLMQKKERFEEVNYKTAVKKDSRCGEESINSAYLNYMFNSPQVSRR